MSSVAKEIQARRALDAIVGAAVDRIGRTATSMVFGRVNSYDPDSGTVNVAIDGETSGTPGIKMLRGYTPASGEGVVLLKKGRQYVGLGSLKKLAAVASGLTWVLAEQIKFWNPALDPSGDPASGRDLLQDWLTRQIVSGGFGVFYFEGTGPADSSPIALESTGGWQTPNTWPLYDDDGAILTASAGHSVGDLIFGLDSAVDTEDPGFDGKATISIDLTIAPSPTISYSMPIMGGGGTFPIYLPGTIGFVSSSSTAIVSYVINAGLESPPSATATVKLASHAFAGNTAPTGMVVDDPEPCDPPDGSPCTS